MYIKHSLTPPSPQKKKKHTFSCVTQLNKWSSNAGFAYAKQKYRDPKKKTGTSEGFRIPTPRTLMKP